MIFMRAQRFLVEDAENGDRQREYVYWDLDKMRTQKAHRNGSRYDL